MRTYILYPFYLLAAIAAFVIALSAITSMGAVIIIFGSIQVLRWAYLLTKTNRS